ncbi:MAG: hypothetical protein K2W94_07470 [Alphaproteobacteria bacterium]|nr:hypothetical protein [Alphaproteobacteria bacterium]
MINFSKIIFIILLSVQFGFASTSHHSLKASSAAASASDSTPFQMKVFDVGQGNCVAIKYNGKSILIDCGTKSLTYTAQYNKASGKGTAVSLKKDTPTKGKATAKADSADESDIDETAQELEKATLHTPSPKAKLRAKVTPARATKDSSSEDSEGEADKKVKEALREAYKNKIIEEIREFLGMTIQAVIITHPDEDHYNLIPEVTAGKTVEKVIISGKIREYSETSKPALQTFRDWIGHYAAENKIILAEGFYFSESPDHPIEHAISFHSSAHGELFPEIKILAMNATTRGAVDSNAGSIVLKITYNGKSILLPGDATKVTWDAIKGTNPDNLKSDYFLISHHGAITHGSTTSNILSEISPKAVFISVGRYRGTYFHPDRSVIDMILKTSGLGEDEDFRTFVTYFSDKKHRRQETSSLIFTTLNNGTITIDLDNSEAHTARAKPPTQYHFEDKLFIADKNFAFREQSVSDPGNPARLFSTLAKEHLGVDKVCFFRIPEGKKAGRAILVLDTMKTASSASETCEHAFLIKQKTSTDEEIIVYLIPESSKAPGETDDRKAASEAVSDDEATSGKGKKAAADSENDDKASTGGRKKLAAKKK